MKSVAGNSTPWTPRVFCAVRPVTTDRPNTRKAQNIFRSAWIPAPPPESEPAIVSAFGMGFSVILSLLRDRAGGRGTPAPSYRPAARFFSAFGSRLSVGWVPYSDRYRS